VQPNNNNIQISVEQKKEQKINEWINNDIHIYIYSNKKVQHKKLAINKFKYKRIVILRLDTAGKTNFFFISILRFLAILHMSIIFF